MANKTLSDELLTMIKSETVNNPAPQKCRITKVYEDMHVDVESLQGLLKYVQVFGTNVKKGDDGILLFLNESYESYVVISMNNSADIDIDNVEIDFNYVFGLSGIDDSLSINAFLKLIGD